MDESRRRRQGRKEGNKEGHAGALQSRWGFRCRGNPSATCVVFALQCASDSPVPVNADISLVLINKRNAILTFRLLNESTL